MYRGVDAFKKHQTSKCHINSLKALSNTTKLESIDCVLNKARKMEITNQYERKKAFREHKYYETTY